MFRDSISYRIMWKQRKTDNIRSFCCLRIIAMLLLLGFLCIALFSWRDDSKIFNKRLQTTSRPSAHFSSTLLVFPKFENTVFRAEARLDAVAEAITAADFGLVAVDEDNEQPLLSIPPPDAVEFPRGPAQNHGVLKMIKFCFNIVYEKKHKLTVFIAPAAPTTASTASLDCPRPCGPTPTNMMVVVSIQALLVPEHARSLDRLAQRPRARGRVEAVRLKVVPRRVDDDPARPDVRTDAHEREETDSHFQLDFWRGLCR